MCPGVLFSLPGGVLRAAVGGQQVSVLGLALMAFGGLWPAGRQLWVGLRGPRDQRRGRGSAEHRALAKMVTYWFSGCEIVLAIAPIRQQSARIGIGFALLALSILAVAGSSALALSATAGAERGSAAAR